MNKTNHGNAFYYNVIIIGAGASGLFCGATAGKRQKKVLILDHANKAGKKILMSGGGRCNFTNYHIEHHHYLSQNPHFYKSALSRFSQWDFLDLVHQYHIPYQSKDDGQLFCQNSANDILQMLLSECQKYDVKIQLKTQIQQIQADTQGFIITAICQQQTILYTCQSLVIATGGLSIPTMGATGFGYQVAKQFGHQIVPTQASLVPFTFTDKMGDICKQLSGISTDVMAFNDKITFTLPMLFTHRGLSGPAMLQLSNYWQLGEPIFVNLLPQLQLDQFLIAQKQQHPKQLLRRILSDFFAKKLLNVLQELLWQDVANIPIMQIKDERLLQLANDLSHWRLQPSGTEGYRTAEVTLGGVATDEISSKTLQSRLQPNLYFIGEVLDVTGWLGGYNFQWAWASGFVAGQAV